MHIGWDNDNMRRPDHGSTLHDFIANRPALFTALWAKKGIRHGIQRWNGITATLMRTAFGLFCVIETQ
jgi:hypothetical protein